MGSESKKFGTALDATSKHIAFGMYAVTVPFPPVQSMGCFTGYAARTTKSGRPPKAPTGQELRSAADFLKR